MVDPDEPGFTVRMADVRQNTRNARNGPLATAAALTLYTAVVTMGLMAGLFYAWDVSVMPGLARLDDRSFVAAMQILIVAIDNLGFGVILYGAFGFTAVAAFRQRRRGQRAAARWIMAALAFYVVAFVITGAVHFPLNDALVAAGDPAGIVDLAAVRAAFEQPWVVANIGRSVTCISALICLGRALALHGQGRASARSA